VLKSTCLISLAGALLLAPVVLAQEARVVRLTTADDVGISAAYYAPLTNPAPALLLLHDYGKSRDEWSGFVPPLQRAGFAVLAIDLRGHGESTRQLTARGPQNLDYHKFEPRDFQDMLLDVDAAFNWITAQAGIDRNRVAIAGSGLGANLAVRYAVFNDDAAAFLLFSPSFVYQGVRTDDVIGKVGNRPVRIVVSQFDGFAFESCKRLIELRKDAGTNDLTVCTGSLHGVALLTGVKQLPGICLAWLRQSLETASPATAPPNDPAAR
jgi:pimeloyl-ACP methyl ester carboxylesterase